VVKPGVHEVEAAGALAALPPAEWPALHALHGHRGVLYGGAEYKGGLTCFACQRSIAP
jgi:hypothetical protein